MKNTSIKIIAIVLCLILSLGAFALAENGKYAMDGFDPSTNWNGTFCGMRFSVPSYFGDDPEATYDNAAWVVQGMNSNDGVPPAYILLDLLNGINSQSDFARLKESFLNEALRIHNTTEVTHYIENCVIANCPATSMQYNHKDNGGNWINRVYLIYNTQAGVAIAVTLAENMAAPADFMDDFEKIIDSIELVK